MASGGHHPPRNPAPARHVYPKVRAVRSDARYTEIGKICARCEQDLPFSAFNFSSAVNGGRPRSRCKKCQQDDYREYTVRGGARVRELKKASKYRRRYKMSLEDLRVYIAVAGGVCEACGNPPDVANNRRLVVDHNHACCPQEYTCGQCVRGILCTPCNAALGSLQDDAERVRRLHVYAEKRCV